MKIRTIVRLASLATRNQRCFRTLLQVRRRGLTYLDAAALMDLYDGVRGIEEENLPGIVVEAGTARGGSALLLAAAKDPRRPLFLYDVFDQIPPPGEKDGNDAHQRYDVIQRGDAIGVHGTRYYGYEEHLLDLVRNSFQQMGFPLVENHVELVPGLFEDRMDIKQPVALAHIDSDWYQSVFVVLERIVPHLVVGGRLIVDDYGQWSGCRKAVDEYFLPKRDAFEYVQKERLHIIRRG